MQTIFLLKVKFSPYNTHTVGHYSCKSTADSALSYLVPTLPAGSRAFLEEIELNQNPLTYFSRE